MSRRVAGLSMIVSCATGLALVAYAHAAEVELRWTLAADGTRIVTNYGTAPYVFEGRTVAPEDWLIY